MQSAYKTEQLIDEGVDFSNIYAEKQGVVKEMTGFDFDLSRIVQFLQKETKQFTVQLPLALDIDRSIYSIYEKWKQSKGEEAEAKPQPKAKEPKAEKPKAEEPSNLGEWKEAIETLQMLIGEGGSDENIGEWNEAVDTLNMLIEETPKMAKGGGIGYKKTKNGVAYQIIQLDSPMGKYKYVIKGVKFGGFGASYITNDVLSETEIERIAEKNK